ncbi:MAG: hypothetical protein IJH84_20635 [Saccharopolyspora sp.]|uniref:hypothetical protein n=1 Tax=Saccharopolyspora TaxID=1835 RepID=UPI00190E2B5D|nr:MULTISPECIES: hypothetical protein [unclassified Saccharopolyspora]MBK0867337.1 hypothetical protein [Saccharopolyspora sp. HNM0986]MBQ6643423.1 hypothetical protein [Saccharopolyspora sp.]
MTRARRGRLPGTSPGGGVGSISVGAVAGYPGKIPEIFGVLVEADIADCHDGARTRWGPGAMAR